MNEQHVLNGKKAVLMDYTGTIIETGGPEIEEMIARVYKNSDFADPREALHYWFGHLSEMENTAYKDSFISEDEICLRILDLCEKEHHLRDNHEELHLLNQNFWRNGPVFEDAESFIKTCGLPVCVLTNNAASYVEENLAKHGIHPAAVASAEEVRAYKPHREIFEHALEILGIRADEAVHIGDSYESDALGAERAGISAVLIDREGKSRTEEREGLTVVRRLTELL